MHSLVPSHVAQIAERGLREDISEGAALIIDAQGSTALASRLQAYGTTGAESLAAVLDAVYEPIVRNVRAEGGAIAAFAGDGVLAVFPGGPSESVDSAVRCAGRIMNQLDQTGDLDTPVGPARLTVRSIVGFGSVEWLIWASPNLDAPQNSAFTCVGSAIAEAQKGETITAGGQLTVGPSARRHLTSSAPNTEISDGFAILPELDPGAAKDPLEESVPAAAIDGRLRFFPPDLARAEIHGEFREVVSVFVEFETRPAQGADSGMARLLESLGEHRGYLCNVIKSDPSQDSVRTLALWGAPRSRERDTEYAVRFLESLRASTAVDRLRAGVTAAVAFAGFVGGSHHESYTAVGVGVSVAARMCDAANWGEIRVDARTASLLDSPWSLEDLGPIEYRGVIESTATYRVLEDATPSAQVAAFDGPLVGRQPELDQLEDLTAVLWAGRSAGIVGVEGDQGIGKSRLIAELRQRLSTRSPSPTWLFAQADEIRSQPMATLRDALVGYFGKPGRSESADRLASLIADLQRRAPDLATALERGRGALGDLLGLAEDVATASKLDPKTRFTNLVFAMEDFLAAIERSTPVIIHMADGQWLDAGTAEILEQVSRDLGEARLALIVESRGPGSEIQTEQRIHLGPLNDADLQRLAMQIADPSTTPELIQVLVERSDGNPYFLEQLVRYVETRKGLDDWPNGSDPQEEDLPIDLRRALVSRLDDLPAPAKRTVQIGSVLGREVDLAVLAEMVRKPDDLDSHVDRAVGVGIWRRLDTTHVAFDSGPVRDAAQGMLLHSDAKELHAAAAEAIEATSGEDERVTAELAFHYDKAGMSAVAAAHYLRAGRAEAGRSSTDEALNHFTRALELVAPSKISERLEILIAIHDVYNIGGDRASQQATIDTMGDLVAETSLESVDVAFLRAQLLISLGDYVTAGMVLDRVDENVMAARDDLQRGSLAFLRAQVARYEGRVEEARAFGLEASQIFDGVGEPARMAAIEDFLGGMAWESGDYEAAAKLHRSAAEVFRRSGSLTDEIQALNNLGSALFAIGDYSAARSIHESGSQQSHTIGYRMGEGDHLDNIGGTAWAIGDYNGALHNYEAALEIRERMEDAWGVAISKSNLGATHRAMGNPGEGLRLYREALAIDQEIGRRRGEAYDLHGIGLCHLDLEHNNLAVESLREAARVRVELGQAHLANESKVAWAVALMRGGNDAEAHELVESTLDAEGEGFFEKAVETTATRLRSIEVVARADPIRAEAMRERLRADISRRAERISDPEDRESYLNDVEAHRIGRTAMTGE